MNTLNPLKIVNPILLALVLSQFITDVIGDRLSHEVFEVLHEGGGILLAVAAVVYLILKWSWVQSTYFKRH